MMIFKNDQIDQMTKNLTWPELQSLYNIRNELSISGKGVILLHPRILIPKSLQKLVVEIRNEAHESVKKAKHC